MRILQPDAEHVHGVVERAGPQLLAGAAPHVPDDRAPRAVEEVHRRHRHAALEAGRQRAAHAVVHEEALEAALLDVRAELERLARRRVARALP
eukprot:213730-Prymnesium_polylepis.1